MAGINEAGGIAVKKYSNALFQLGAELGEEAFAALQKEAEALIEILRKEPELEQILINPCVSADEKMRLVERALTLSDNMLGFLDTVLRKKRQSVLTDILEAFIAAADRNGGALQAVIYSPQPLTQTDIEKISDIISRKTDRQVYLDVNVEPSLIGGIQVHAEGILFDGTVKGKLERMRSALEAIS